MHAFCQLTTPLIGWAYPGLPDWPVSNFREKKLACFICPTLCTVPCSIYTTYDLLACYSRSLYYDFINYKTLSIISYRCHILCVAFADRKVRAPVLPDTSLSKCVVEATRRVGCVRRLFSSNVSYCGYHTAHPSEEAPSVSLLNERLQSRIKQGNRSG
jgi:hypothetical protein